jgi:alkanesulfonate monooxygenase SsuD/methylene tetrahydromethanopterin reductase-like flavin-dependent oxidoreductase (luciferase family)
VPALDRGRARAGGDRPRPEIGGLVFVAAGRDDAELEAAIAAVKYRIAFYGSTPAYKPVLDLHGWGDLQPQFNAMTKQGRWNEMAALVPDEVLHELAAVGTPEEAGRKLAANYGGAADRVTLDMPYKHHPETELAVAQAARAATA